MLFIGVEVEQKTSAPLLKKILDPPLLTIKLSISIDSSLILLVQGSCLNITREFYILM